MHEIEMEEEDFSVDLRKEWSGIPEEWRYDAIPEISNGKNVADFIDPDILQVSDVIIVGLVTS